MIGIIGSINNSRRPEYNIWKTSWYCFVNIEWNMGGGDGGAALRW